MTTQNFVFSLLVAASLRTFPAAAQEAEVGSDSVTPASSANSTVKISDAMEGFWKDVHLTGGQLTLPFKIRPKAETQSFRLTTDVTVGAYVGLSKRLSSKKNHFLTIPFAAGLTFVNLNSNNTSLDSQTQEAEVVPGITWCFGGILQLERYSIGLMFGQDFASEVGNQWEHHGQFWWSFGIGFTFVRGGE